MCVWDCTSKCCCVFSTMRVFSLLSCWFSSCSLMMLFLAMANWEQNEQIASLIVPVTAGYVMILQSLVCLGRLESFKLTFKFCHTDCECVGLTSSMSLELDFSRESTLPWRPWTVVLDTQTHTNMFRVSHFRTFLLNTGVTSHSWGVFLLSLNTVQLITAVWEL